MSKTVKFPAPDMFYDFLAELKTAYDEDRLENFICIYNFKYRQEDKLEEFMYGIGKHWFGQESCIYMLGLIDIMKDEIREFMKEKIWQIEEGRI